jgi:hypothetical protein
MLHEIVVFAPQLALELRKQKSVIDAFQKVAPSLAAARSGRVGGGGLHSRLRKAVPRELLSCLTIGARCCASVTLSAAECVLLCRSPRA